MTKTKRRKMKSAKDVRLELNELYHFQKEEGKGNPAYTLQTLLTALKLEKEEELLSKAFGKTSIDDLVEILATQRKEQGIDDDND